ncbi:MAG: peptide ABC transporter substrate-binding protein [Gammaproteobacteria bacterium]|nr:peptide ABC transporter substrate-binding protein [Gammaproteobacteria bacterium]
MRPDSALRFVAGLALAVLLTACDSPEPKPAPTEIVIGNSADPGTLDPHRAEGVPARNIQRDLFEGLVARNRAGDLVPGVAAEWQYDADTLTWTFSLRDDARWSNGDPLTADDFVRSFQRALSPNTAGVVSETLLPIRNAAAVIAGDVPPAELGVSAADALTLKIQLEGPTPYFLALLDHPSTVPVHASTDESAELVSNGAYRLLEWRVNDYVLLERNPHYRDAASVAIDRVRFLPISDMSVELNRFRAGELDITYGIPPGRMAWLAEQYPDALRVNPWFGVYYLGLNVDDESLNDPGVRRALAMAIDRETLVESITPGGETVAFSWVPAFDGYPLVVPGWAAGTLQQRQDEARQILARAGYDENNKLSLDILYNNRDRDQRIMSAVAAMWEESLPVEAQLDAREWKVYLGIKQRKLATQVFRSGWIGEYQDPFTFAEVFGSTHGMNEFNWASERYDALLAQARETEDTAARFRLLAEAERIVLDELPAIPLFHYAKARLVSPRVEGYSTHPLDHHYTRHLSFRREAGEHEDRRPD